MQVRIVNPGELLPVLIEDTELRGPDDMPRIWLEPGSNPPNLPKVAPKVANLRHVVMRNLHDVSAIWSHPTETPVDIRAALEWDDVYSDLHGWFCPGDTIRPSGLHGHPGYFQDDERFGTRTIRRCVFGRSFAGTAGKVYAESNNSEAGVQYSKTANYVIEDCVFFGGSFLIGNFGAGNRDAVNITVRRCVFINSDLTVGYNGHSCQNNVVEDCTIFGTLTVKAGADITVRNNAVIVSPPYRDAGTLYDNGSGSVSTNWGWLSTYTNPVFEGNRLFTDGPQSAFNGRSRAQMRTGGGMVGDLHLPDNVVVRPLAEAPAFIRRIDIPERDAAWVVVYNPAGALTIPLDDYYRVRDVRRWHSSYVSNELVMAGEPDAPVNWPPEYGPPPIAPNMFPEFGIFRLEPATPEEVIVTIEERLIAVETELASIRAAYLAEVAVKDAQIITLTTERDVALASASVFRGVLGSVNALVAGYPPVA